MIDYSLTFTPRLDRIGKSGDCSVALTVCWAGYRVRASSGVKVIPEYWVSDLQRVSRMHSDNKSINRTLSLYDKQIHDYFDDLTRIPSESEVTELIDGIRVGRLGKKPKIITPEAAPVEANIISLSEFALEYVRQRRTERSPIWCAIVGTVSNHLRAFRPNLQWSDLTLNTLNQFKAYLQEEEELSDNTLETYVGILRGMLKYATLPQYKIPVPSDYTWLETRIAGDVVRPVLSHADIDSIRNADLKQVHDAAHYQSVMIQPGVIESTHWYFLMACGTGLRYSDLWQLITPKIATIEGVKCVEVMQQKTGKRVQIPMSDDTYYLLKHPVAKTKPVVLDHYNEILKPIGQAANLTTPVTVGSYYAGRFLSDTIPLHDTLSSHMARRSFATLMTEGGLPTRVLQEIMGHKFITSTQKYAHLSSSAVVHQTIEAWKQSKLR